MNRLVSALENYSNYKTTENGATALRSTKSMVYDMFALGGAYRSRSNEDCILLFKNAIEENPLLGLKCLFYLRDAREGQGERRFFRICLNWLAKNYPGTVLNNLDLISEYGRWDDLYCLVNTPVEKDMFAAIRKQINLDLESKTPSLLAKWLKSENASSNETRQLGNKTRKALGLSHKEYRKVLSHLRERINIVERLMSSNRWDLIEFDKLPSKAGFIYKNAFARRDIIKEEYKVFATNKDTKVNAKTLYPYEVVAEAAKVRRSWWNSNLDETTRAMINKYWDNLTDYFNGASLNALAVVDTSGSMYGQPLDVAISLGLYCADKARGPFHDHFISFSSRPQFIKCEGVDFVDKVHRIYSYNLCENTNLEATFDLVLDTAIQNRLSQDDLPASLIIISDMEIDRARYGYDYGNPRHMETTMATIRRKWEQAGYKVPSLIYWNINARNNTILDENQDVTYVSGFSPVIFEEIMSGKRGYDLMLSKLNSDRYSMIKL